MRALESFISELGRRIAGVFTIPIAAKMAGGSVTVEQSLWMVIIFSVTGFLWVYLLRVFFSKKGESCNKCEEK